MKKIMALALLTSLCCAQGIVAAETTVKNETMFPIKIEFAPSKDGTATKTISIAPETSEEPFDRTKDQEWIKVTVVTGGAPDIKTMRILQKFKKITIKLGKQLPGMSPFQIIASEPEQ